MRLRGCMVPHSRNSQELTPTTPAVADRPLWARMAFLPPSRYIGLVGHPDPCVGTVEGVRCTGSTGTSTPTPTPIGEGCFPVCQQVAHACTRGAPVWWPVSHPARLFSGIPAIWPACLLAYRQLDCEIFLTRYCQTPQIAPDYLLTSLWHGPTMEARQKRTGGTDRPASLGGLPDRTDTHTHKGPNA